MHTLAQIRLWTSFESSPASVIDERQFLTFHENSWKRFFNNHYFDNELNCHFKLVKIETMSTSDQYSNIPFLGNEFSKMFEDLFTIRLFTMMNHIYNLTKNWEFLKTCIWHWWHFETWWLSFIKFLRNGTSESNPTALELTFFGSLVQNDRTFYPSKPF